MASMNIMWRNYVRCDNYTFINGHLLRHIGLPEHPTAPHITAQQLESRLKDRTTRGISSEKDYTTLPIGLSVYTAQHMESRLKASATLVHAFIASRVDYCNTVLAGSPRTITDRIQRVLNAAARVVSGQWYAQV